MSIRLMLVSVASVIALSSTAAAASNRTPTEVFVSSVGVDFSDPAETATFYAALSRAAAKACESGMERNLGALAADRRCAAASLDRAVRQMDRAALVALHERRTGHPSLAATVLASK